MERAKVYFTKNITREGLLAIYEALNKELKGRVAVKISTGEMGGHNYLDPNLIKDLVHKLNGTIVECNTAYPGKRMKTEEHLATAKAHGFCDIAEVDIMDSEGSIEIPVNYQGHLQNKNIVGSHINNYDSMLVLSHFKGHPMGGYGGALKQLSIGCASSAGKTLIHTAGVTNKQEELFNNLPDQDKFLEAMADAASSVVDYFKGNTVYINIMKNISIDCDCDGNASAPCMKDIGILASLDPIAIDQACLDLVYNSTDLGKDKLINRIESRHGVHTIEASAELGFGTREYELIDIA